MIEEVKQIEIKVFIPTYKRLRTLEAVLYSLIKAENIFYSNFIYKCYIINNYPRNENWVNKIVDEFNNKYQTSWEFIAIHREVTLPPAINWYNAILDYCEFGDVVFLQGDDDLFLPNSISFRTNTLIQNQADLLISTFVGGVLFYDKIDEISIDGFDGYTKESEIKSIDFSPEIIGSIFIGNNTYRFTEKLRNAIELSITWSKQLDWVPIEQSTLLVPINLPLALLVSNGKVISTKFNGVIRGMNKDEVDVALWGVPTWNSGILHWIMLGVLENKELKPIKQLVSLKIWANDYAATWYWTYFFDPRISKKMLVNTRNKIGRLKFSFKTFKTSVVFFFKSLLMMNPPFRFLKNYLKPKVNFISPITFIDKIDSYLK